MDRKEEIKAMHERMFRDNTSPLSVFLVKSGSQGNRLLFRYPYEITDNYKEYKSQIFTNSLTLDHGTRSRNPFLCRNPEDFTNQPDRDLVQNQTPTRSRAASGTDSGSMQGYQTDPYIATVVSLSDKVLSDLFAVKPELCGQKFEVKINDIRFVGHPISLESADQERVSQNDSSSTATKDLERDLVTFNVVFAVRANASHDIVNCYAILSERIALSLEFEERRVGYLSSETAQMLKSHERRFDEEEDTGSPLAFVDILSKSLLAEQLKKVFEDLTIKGSVHVCINNWVNLSFCLPQKVHRLRLRHFFTLPQIGPQNIQSCFNHLRPYHGILLLCSTEQLKENLPQDASPAFFRVINFVTPTKNLLELSADSDVSLQQVFHVVAQLVYWGFATIIFPLCESNLYTVHPMASTYINSELIHKFREAFKGENLLEYMAEFSLGVTLGSFRPPKACTPGNLIARVSWMLRHRLLLQQHCYVFLTPTARNPPFVSIPWSSHSRPMSTEPTVTINSGDVDQEHLLNLKRNTQLSGSSSPLQKTPSQIAIIEESAASLDNLGLSEAEIEAILRVPASKNLDDLKLFIRLCPYFNGKRHLEDIMYYENVRRSQLLALIDKFREILLTAHFEDAAVSFLLPSGYELHPFVNQKVLPSSQ